MKSNINSIFIKVSILDDFQKIQLTTFAIIKYTLTESLWSSPFVCSFVRSFFRVSNCELCSHFSFLYYYGSYRLLIFFVQKGAVTHSSCIYYPCNKSQKIQMYFCLYYMCLYSQFPWVNFRRIYVPLLWLF